VKILSLILARGGSKGIPDKNITELKGKPLMQYVIEASQQSRVDETWVSSDSQEIRKVSHDLGAYTITRPESISQDHSKSDEALVHFAETIDFDTLVFIQPTSPLLTAKDINKGLIKMNNYDSVFSVYKEHWIPEWDLDGTPHNWNLNDRPMRQDVPETYVENGAFYITKQKALLDSGLRYSGKVGMVEMPKHRSFQIDTPDDLALIEKLIT
jgi:N-acylneuraminate cytidylyltransferase